MSKQGWDIVAFKVPDHHSILYRTFLTGDGLHKAIDDAIQGGANVCSIRWSVQSVEPASQSKEASERGAVRGD
ncbi:MAG: hypothetical protein KGI38_12745 [Thaumarchaeota archaeon]|nr:hypothetical protein [Nitrososphaerota archaeon]